VDSPKRKTIVQIKKVVDKWEFDLEEDEYGHIITYGAGDWFVSAVTRR